MAQSKQPAPWYAAPKKEDPKFIKNLEKLYQKWLSTPTPASRNLNAPAFFAGVLISAVGGFLTAFAFWPNAYAITKVLAVAFGLTTTGIGVWAILHAFGSAAKPLLKVLAAQPAAITGYLFLKSDHKPSEPRSSVPAPELALQSFTQQVRAYAHEVNYVRGREQRGETNKIPAGEATDLMKRRWNEVVDSLNEFEIYLANAPSAVIENLVQKSPTQHMDVSQVFREVAEAFDTTWRRKGINIESAIVSPLKATANEALLRRILVGPWRSSAYFARRGTGVVFSAKASGSTVIATWETNGLCMPEAFLATALNTSISLNERLELGMAALCIEPASSSSTFLGLLSFLTWVDLAKACQTEFELKNGNEGFQIILRLH